MYTVQQLQAADYLLKSVLSDTSYENDIKLVIEFNGSYWYGDFVNYEHDSVWQFSGRRTEYFDFGNTTLLRKIWDTYSNATFRLDNYVHPNYFGLLFSKLFELIENANILPSDSPIFPYLLNAKSLDGKLELPFINIGKQTVQVISFMEIPTTFK